MNLDEIRQILDMVREHELAEFELEQDGVKLRLRKGGVLAAPPTSAVMPAVLPAHAVVAPDASLAAASAAAEEGQELAMVTAPIVGTFYRSPSPEAPAFVDVGTRVKKGQVLCIIEAMKLMNEIEAEHDGEVVKVYVENGQPVQYGDRLFAFKQS